jgi:ABC-type amino acid transport substrate-binding protein
LSSRIKSLTLTIFMILALGSSSISLSGHSLAQSPATSFDALADENASAIRIGGDTSYPPYEYVDMNGEFKGFNVDIIKAVARESGLSIKLVPMAWSEALDALESGSISVIQGMTQSPDRDKSFDFTDSIVINSQAIFVNSGTVSIAGIGDLPGKRVAYQQDDVSKLIIDGIQDVVPIEVPDQRTAMEMLIDGKADAFIGNRLTGMYNIQTYGKTDNIKIVGEAMFESPYSIAVAEGNSDLLLKLNMGLSAIKSSGEYDRIYKYWFGEMMDDSSAFLKGLLTVVGVALLALLGFTLTVMAWNRSLKRQVDKAMRDMLDKNDQLESSNRQKGMIIDSISSGIVAFDSGLTVIRSNSSANRLFDKDDISGMTYYDLEIDERLGPQALQSADSDGGWRGHVEWKSSSTGKMSIDAIFMPIKDPISGEGYILFMHDFTREGGLQRTAT